MPKIIGESAPDKVSAGPRVISIDVLRGFALVCMVVVHFMIYYGNDAAAETFLYFFLNDGLADYGAAMFLMMMGMSQVLSASRMDNADNWIVFKRALLRGGYLFCVGLLMLLMAFGPSQMWRWDILTIMGVATVVLFFCRFLPSWSLLAIAGAIAVLSPLLRNAFDIAAEWGGNFVPTPFISNYVPGLFLDPAFENIIAWNSEKIVKGFFLSGLYPVFPWLTFPIIGFVLGRRIVKGQLKGDLPALLIMAVVFTALGLGLAFAGRTRPASSIVNGFVSPLSFYPDSFPMICFQTGMSLILFTGMYYLYDVRSKDRTKLGPLARLFTRTSNFALTFYFLHYMLLGWPVAIIYFVTGRYLLEGMMGAVPALLCGIVAVTFLEVLIYFLEKRGSRFCLESLLVSLTRLIIPTYQRGIKKTT